MQYDYDVVIVGSGFGGSVSALRLIEAGFKVLLIEQGKRATTEEIKKANSSAKHLAWAPALGRYGFLAQDVYQHMGIVRGVGVGGGSLVYAAVLLEPKARFYTDPIWAHLSKDWQTELSKHYQTAKQMLGVGQNPYRAIQDDWLEKTAQALGCKDSFEQVPQGIYFGAAHIDNPDPYFNGKGPLRRGCTQCGKCITGCAEGAKNSLDYNYLYFAEQKGLTLWAETKVTHISKGDDGYIVHYHPLQKPANHQQIRAKHVILSAGVIGTLEILFASRDVYKTLPDLPQSLGEHVRTNSEAIVAIVAGDQTTDVTKGTTISTHFHADDVTHITQNRFPASYEFMKYYMGPLVDDHRPLRRAFKTLWAILVSPLKSSLSWRTRQWYKRVSVLTVMQQADNEMRFRYGRTLLRAGRRALKSGVSVGARAPSYLPQANEAARVFARVSDGEAQNVLFESLGHLSVTAHILGGAVMADSAEKGVIDVNHQVFGYPELYVVDGSSIPVNIGVNPSLTITAMAERFAERFIAQHPKQQTTAE